MPDSEKKRIKPVIEEIVETPDEQKATEPETAPVILEDPKVETEPAVAEAVSSKADSDRKMNLKLIIVITLVSALVAAVVSGGVYAYLSGIDSQDTSDEGTPAPSPSASPTPVASATPEPKVDLSTLSVQVLNGSGAIGAAGGAQDVLESAGFEIKNTANAKNYNFEKTVVQVKSGVSASVAAIAKKALEDGSYEVEMGDTLTASSAYDLVVTVGKN